jgi:hypothetical protein
MPLCRASVGNDEVLREQDLAPAVEEVEAPYSPLNLELIDAQLRELPRLERR